jgi:1-acyl-sn-glycerol-3-phosphate acyltransferase
MNSWIWMVVVILILLAAWQVRLFLRACRKANRVNWGKDLMNLIDGFNRIFCYSYHRLNVLRLRIPSSGPAVVVSNHISGIDANLLIASARRPLRFLIAREEYERFGFTWLYDAARCIPVDRERNPERALRAALRALENGEVVALFPHGKIHLDSDPPRKIKAGAVRLAEMANAPIVPLRITGIKGAGHVFRGILYRSRAQIEAYPLLLPSDMTHRELMAELQQILDGKVKDLGPRT